MHSSPRGYFYNTINKKLFLNELPTNRRKWAICVKKQPIFIRPLQSKQLSAGFGNCEATCFNHSGPKLKVCQSRWVEGKTQRNINTVNLRTFQEDHQGLKWQVTQVKPRFLHRIFIHWNILGKKKKHTRNSLVRKKKCLMQNPLTMLRGKSRFKSMRLQFHETDDRRRFSVPPAGHTCAVLAGALPTQGGAHSAPPRAPCHPSQGGLRGPPWEGSAAKPRLTPLGLAFSKRAWPWKAPPYSQNIYEYFFQLPLETVC